MAWSQSPPSRDRTVSNSAQFGEALKTARDGDVINLEPGRYSTAALSGLHFAQSIVIRSRDPKHPATLVGLKLDDTAGLHFSDLELTGIGVADDYYWFRIFDSQRLTFDHVDAHGDPSREPGVQASGFYIKGCTGIEISQSRLHDMNSAIVAGPDDQLRFVGNTFDRLSKGGIELAAITRSLIADNVFTNFLVDPGTHPDAIQLFTAATKTPSRNVTISGNLYYRGKGHAIQGIFIGDEAGLPYENLTVTGNAMIGGGWHAIYIDTAAGDLIVNDNVVASWPGPNFEGDGTPAAKTAPIKIQDFYAWIKLDEGTAHAKVQETGNLAQAYVNSAQPGRQPPHNKLLGAVSDDGRALVRAWSASHGRAPPPDL